MHVCVLRAGVALYRMGVPVPWPFLEQPQQEQALQQGLRAQGLLITPLVPQMHSCSAAYNIKLSSAGDGVLVISNNTYV